MPHSPSKPWHLALQKASGCKLKMVCWPVAQVRAGKRVVLPSSFSGGPRDMNQRYHDGMAAVRKKGKPSLFVTMTCNPYWGEILDALEHGQVCRRSFLSPASLHFSFTKSCIH